MTLAEALKAVGRFGGGGSVYFKYAGVPYRLVVRDGYFRLVLVELGEGEPLPPDRALELLKEIAPRADTIEAFPSPVEVALRPPAFIFLANPQKLGFSP